MSDSRKKLSEPSYKLGGQFGSGLKGSGVKRSPPAPLAYLDRVPPKAGAAVQVLLAEAVRLYLGDVEATIAKIRNGAETKDWKNVLQIRGPLAELNDSVSRLERVLRSGEQSLRACSRGGKCNCLPSQCCPQCTDSPCEPFDEVDEGDDEDVV